MTYEFINTIIDDLFAFFLSRCQYCIASQRWIYPVDKKCVNEFGLEGEEKKDVGMDGLVEDNVPSTDENAMDCCGKGSC